MRLLPDEFALALNEDIMRQCRVVWRTETQAGIEFLPMPAPPKYHDAAR